MIFLLQMFHRFKESERRAWPFSEHVYSMFLVAPLCNLVLGIANQMKNWFLSNSVSAELVLRRVWCSRT